MSEPAEIWRRVEARRWRRGDGAEVWESVDHYYSNPLNPRCRLWEGAGPGDNQILMRARRSDRRELGRSRRRFGSAAAAMAAVDLAHPPKLVIG